MLNTLIPIFQSDKILKTKAPAKAIPYGRQTITDDDIQAVISTLRSDYLTQGPAIAEFEKQFAVYTDAKYAVALSNGTAALHLCAMALNVNASKRVITTPITFAASANCIRYCGGEVFFADIDQAVNKAEVKFSFLWFHQFPIHGHQHCI